MKRFVVLCFACLALCLSSCGGIITDARAQAIEQQGKAADTAISSIPIPSVTYFQERRTISKWIQRWDKPSVPTYVYLVSYGHILGYYVADGKPSSTRSYLTPEENVQTGYQCSVVVSAPDLDGTYGDNNPGIRFFTAEGVAVEWGGEGSSYLYSDAPIDFGYTVPKLNSIKK